ncbi:hypothetical protein [Paucibacter soli]|uniref:hypothetical protein n=1 Tax=Paucibacter soli TaxID=3133433 RepID=UPI0030B15080
MPRLTANSLLQRAISPAVLDRESLADAYGKKGETAAQAMDLAGKIQNLRGRRFDSLSEDELNVAMCAFIYAEQWEQSLAESRPGKDVERRARRNAAYFKTLRHQIWGKTQLEVSLERGTRVNIESLP